MKKAIYRILLVIYFCKVANSSQAFAKEKAAGRSVAQSSSISEIQFNKVADSLRQFYSPIASSHGAKLRLEANWNDNSLEAHSGKKENDWFVYIAGGIARDRDANLDSYTFTLCHEFGHQFGGYPFVNLPGNIWNSREGVVDYYAAFVCARNLWKDQITDNQNAQFSVEPNAKQECDNVWKTDEDRNLCYRVTTAGKRTLLIEAKRQNQSVPNFSTPEKNQVANLQCRLDSILQGALCSAPYDIKKIPGYLNPNGINSLGAQEEQRKATCDVKYGYKFGLKPKCWWP